MDSQVFSRQYLLKGCNKNVQNISTGFYKRYTREKVEVLFSKGEKLQSKVTLKKCRMSEVRSRPEKRT